MTCRQELLSAWVRRAGLAAVKIISRSAHDGFEEATESGAVSSVSRALLSRRPICFTTCSRCGPLWGLLVAGTLPGVIVGAIVRVQSADTEGAAGGVAAPAPCRLPRLLRMLSALRIARVADDRFNVMKWIPGAPPASRSAHWRVA